MADARRERIAVAMVAALTAGCAPILVERNRRSPVDADEAPALVLYDGDHEASLIDMGFITYQMTVNIEGTSPEQRRRSALPRARFMFKFCSPFPTFAGRLVHQLG